MCLVYAMDRHIISPSLLKLVGERKTERISSNFCLGIADFCQCENCKPSEEIETTNPSKNSAKRLKLSLTKEKSCFAPPVSEDRMIELSKGKKCVNTDRNTNWAIGVL